MSRNIKEIGKELMGKSLNSFHRKTGLTQLEKNNEMQDGILNGILSQVDDAYIEKTEQSNVIHLDGSGDGVVVLDSIEGNTMVNYVTMEKFHNKSNLITVSGNKITMGVNPNSMQLFIDYDIPIKDNTCYILKVTLKNLNSSNGVRIGLCNKEGNTWTSGSTDFKEDGTYSLELNSNLNSKYLRLHTLGTTNNSTTQEMYVYDLFLIESENLVNNQENQTHFEGLQSSFEEKVTEQGKYEIEILSNNKCLNKITSYKSTVREYTTGYVGVVKIIERNIKVNPNETYTLSYTNIGDQLPSPPIVLYSGKPYPENASDDHNDMYTFCSNNKGNKYAHITTNGGYGTIGNNGHLLNKTFHFKDIKLEKGTNSGFVPHKQNKIKLLINEPLRSIDNIKDRLCVKDGKLVVERKIKQVTYDGSENWVYQDATTSSNNYLIVSDIDLNSKLKVDKVPYLINVVTNTNHSIEGIGVKRVPDRVELVLNVLKSKLPSLNSNGIKNWISQNNLTVCYQLAEPTYEEVLNEYGEPILLEGYENGTIYIDSTIVPTTTVRYTPKMESFKTLKEVNNDNIMLTNDINDNIIPYLMDVDLMIMEKEMALPSKANIRTMEVLDMTSMQKRTQDMLERLIKGKTLTEQECKTRITTYLNAGKITDEQAKELNFLIDEIYA